MCLQQTDAVELLVVDHNCAFGDRKVHGRVRSEGPISPYKHYNKIPRGE